MKTRRTVALVATVAIAASLVVSCSKKKQAIEERTVPTEFSAGVLSETPMGSFEGKLFIKDDKARMEFPQSVVIIRQDLGKVWVLMPAQKAYLEQEMKPEYAFSIGGTFPGEISRELVGTEEVNGFTAEKYKITYTLDGEDGEDTVFQWIDTETGIPIRTQAADGTWTAAYKDIVVESQPDVLFEIDEGYARMVMPKIAVEPEKKPSGGKKDDASAESSE